VRAATAPPEYVPAIFAPPRFDLDWYLGKLNNELMGFPQYRRKITRTDPLLFALMYMEHRLIDPTVSQDIHLSQFHVDMAFAAESWLERNLEPAQIRQAWIAPRGAAKSTWLCCILVIWALAHGHRRFVAAFAANDSAAKRILANIKYCLDNYELLNKDFPDLCTAAKVSGRAVSDAKNMYVARSGQVIIAYGVDSNQLGANIHGMRPDIILLDDIEDDEGNYSLHQKKQRLATVGSILPMNDRAVVQWAGTTTMYGSATHDLVRTLYGERADWVDEYEFKPRHYPAIVTRDDGSEESIWPVKWSLDRLQAIRHTRLYALQYDNRPRSLENGLFSPSDVPQVRTSYMEPSFRVLHVDPAVTTKSTSDYTGLAVAGFVDHVQKAVVEYAVGLRLTPDERKKMVGRIARDNKIDVVLFETNNGGHTYREQIEPMLPPGCRFEEVHNSRSKNARFEEFLDYCQMGWVMFAEEFPELREQMLGFPALEYDDVLDAGAGAVNRVLQGRKRAKVLS